MLRGDNDITGAGLTPEEASTTGVDLPDLGDEESQEQQGGLRPEDVFGVQEEQPEGGTQEDIDSSQGLTPQEALQRTPIQQARNMLPQEQDRGESIPILESAANMFMQGLTEYVPRAIQTKAVLQTELQNLFRSEDEEIDPQNLVSYQGGRELGEELKEIFPDNPEYRDHFWAGTMAKAAGNFVPQIAMAIGTAGAGTAATLASQSALTATLGSQFYEEARAEGASNEEAFSHTLVNMAGTAGLEAIPMTKFAKRVDDITGGGWKRLLANGFSGSIEEGTTEALQEFLSNASGQAIYDSSRELLDNVPTAFAAGALLGSVANATIPALNERMQKAKIEQDLESMMESHRSLVEFASAVEDTPLSPEDVTGILDRVADRNSQQVREKATQGFSNKNGAGMLVEEYSPGVKGRLEKFWAEWLRPGGVLGEDIQRREELMNAAIGRNSEEALLNLTDLNERVLNEYDSDAKNFYEAAQNSDDPVPIEITSQIDQAMRSSDFSNLPKQLREPVKRMRMHIDNLSQEFKKVGLIQGDLVQTFTNNMGQYIHTSYRAFDQNVEWNENVIPDDVWNSAVAFMRNQRLKAYRQERGEAPTGDQLSQLELQAEKDVKTILASKSINSVSRLFENKQIANNRADRSVLMEKQNVPQPIADLLGVYKDPAVNYVNTIEEMSQIVEKRRFYDDLAERFDDSLFFDEIPIDRSDYESFVYGLETGTESAIEKKYMHSDLRDALTYEAGNNDVPGWLSTWMRINGVAKYAKTALSHVSHARNLMGGSGFLINNGHMFSTTQREASWRKAASAFQSYRSLNESGKSELWKTYVELGLTEGSVKSQEFEDVVADMDFSMSGFMENNFNQLRDTGQGRQSAWESTKSFFRKYSKKASNLYKAEDSFLRIWMYELEKARLQEADPEITDQQVADLVNDLYPNYNRLNESLKLARRLPMIAPFISFPAEVLRTSVNTAKRASFEINHENPGIRKIGWQRVGGMMTNMAGVAAVGAASQALMRMDDEEEQAIRQFFPPWDQNSIVAYLDSSRGRVRYINTSYTNPYEFLSDPLFALLQGDSDRDVMDRAWDSMNELFAPLLSEELATKALLEIRANQNDNGYQIWNPEDPLADKLQKGFAHFWSAVEPGSITSVERFQESIVEPDSRREVSDELLGLFGLRISTVDVPRSFGFRIRDYRQRIRDARKVYNSVKYSKGSTRQERRDALERANSRYREIFREMQQITDAAQKTGVRWQELESIMDESGLASRDIDGLRSGTWEPFEP